MWSQNGTLQNEKNEEWKPKDYTRLTQPLNLLFTTWMRWVVFISCAFVWKKVIQRLWDEF